MRRVDKRKVIEYTNKLRNERLVLLMIMAALSTGIFVDKKFNLCFESVDRCEVTGGEEGKTVMYSTVAAQP